MTSDSVIGSLRHRLDILYGDRLRRAVLFGSRARSDARDDSDYDVAIFIDDIEPFAVESRRLAEMEVDLLRETGAIVSVLPFAADAYEARTPLMHEVRRDGFDI